MEAAMGDGGRGRGWEVGGEGPILKWFFCLDA